MKDGDTGFERWTRAELTARFIRNVHPCNYFFIAKADWQRFGGDQRVIAFFAERFAARYESVWSDFLRVAKADASTIPRVSGPIRYEYEYEVPLAASVPNDNAGTRHEVAYGLDRQASANTVSYRSNRLLFKAAVIEPLESSQRFAVITPHGTFDMTKADFYRAFPNVPQSRSYREAGVYHYPTIPRAAREFLITASEPDDQRSTEPID